MISEVGPARIGPKTDVDIRKVRELRLALENSTGATGLEGTRATRRPNLAPLRIGSGRAFELRTVCAENGFQVLHDSIQDPSYAGGRRSGRRGGCGANPAGVDPVAQPVARDLDRDQGGERGGGRRRSTRLPGYLPRQAGARLVRPGTDPGRSAAARHGGADPAVERVQRRRDMDAGGREGRFDPESLHRRQGRDGGDRRERTATGTGSSRLR